MRQKSEIHRKNNDKLIAKKSMKITSKSEIQHKNNDKLIDKKSMKIEIGDCRFWDHVFFENMI